MDELEKMKQLWKEVHQNQPNYTQLSQEQLMENLSKKSTNIFTKLTKSVRLELLGFVIGIPIILSSAFLYSSSEIKIATFLFCVMGLVLLAVLWKDFARIQHYTSQSATLKQNLSDAISHLDTFVSLYLKVYMFLWPMVGVFYYYYIFKHVLKSPISEDESLIYLFASVILSTFIGYFIQKWYTEWMYGKYLNQLRNLKNELESERL
jgi:hypothetical protein